MTTTIIIGPPGTGKTTTLGDRVRACVEAGEKPLVCSLTRAAAQEIVSRNLPVDREQVSTLHAHAYRAIGSPPVVASRIKEWNAGHPALALSGGTVDPDEPLGEQRQSTAYGDEACNDYHLLRARMVARDLWPERVRSFAKQFEEWKDAREVVDFTDMIDRAMPHGAPGSPQIIFADECQDHSRLELALLKRWAQNAGQLVIVGDPWQCQPAGTMVRTPGGDVRIECLDPKLHKLVSFNRRESIVTGLRNPLAFSVSSRPFSGDLIMLYTEGLITRCTPNHQWTVRISPNVRTSGLYAVYLMQKGTRFRVGRCKLFRSPGLKDAGTFGPSTRAHQEHGDKVWVLRTTSNCGDAEKWQQIVSCTWGIPTTCFADHVTLRKNDSGTRNHGHRTARMIDEIYESIPTPRADECLRSFKRDYNYPFWARPGVDGSSQKIGKRIPLTVHACNLFPEFMQVPIPDKGKKFHWSSFSFTRTPYHGLVYSLDVERHEHYIADGIITHNSLYTWRGAHPQMFSSTKVPDSHRHILNQSYRVPRAVHAAAIRWVSKLSDYAPIDYHPRNEDGTAGLLDTSWRWPEPVLDLAERHLDDGQSVMICASCGYLLGPTLAALRLRGLPYSNPWRRRRGDWNPIRVGGRGTSMGERIAAFLKPLSDDDSETSFDFGDAAGGIPWTIEDVHKWASIVKADGLLGRGSKKQIADNAESTPGVVVTPQLLFEWFLPGVLPFLDEMMAGGVSVADALSWLEANLLGTKKPAASFPLTVVRRRGRDGLNEPRLYVGTIHSFKGAEADVVILYPDLSPQGMREWTTEGEGKDSVIRMFYVGLTRARHSVYVCRAASGIAANVWESLN